MPTLPTEPKDSPVSQRALKRRRKEWFLRTGIFVFSALLTTLILVAERSSGIQSNEFVLGEPAPQTLFAPIAVTYEDTESTEALRQKADADVPMVIVFQPEKAKESRVKLESFLAVLERAKITQSAGQDAGPILAQMPFFIPDTAMKNLLAHPNVEEIRKNLDLLLTQTLERGVIASPQKESIRQDGRLRISLKYPDHNEKNLALDELLTVEEAHKFAEGILRETLPKDDQEKQAVLDIFNAIAGPNVAVDYDETQKRRKQAQEAVPAVEEQIKKNELVIQRGMLVNAEEKFKIDLIDQRMATKKALYRFAAMGLLVSLTYLFGFFYMLFFESRTLLSIRTVLLVHVILILSLLFSRGLLFLPAASAYLMPAALAALLLALLVNARLGVLCGAVMAVLASAMVGFKMDILIATLFSSTAGVFAAFRVRKRIQFLMIGAAVGFSYSLTIFAFRIFEEIPLTDALMISLQGLGNGLLITMPLAFLLLPVLEWAFDLVTDITLLELSDLNHPILKRMIVEAPGTYHHSLVVSTLAESACEAIGANALLARVGCYFHDIGKIARAEYFTENQAYQSRSQHEKLTPTMSCLVIMNHVRDGIELGHKYKLREPILRFIPEHQGTGVIYYFYKKALDAAEKDEKVNVEDFRYPGPKPQTKETAVAMLADSTEAASRTLKDPSPDNIRHLVRKIINDKFTDGQLDECPLALRDLHKIQESFIQNLMAIFHTRVAYPVKPQTANHLDLFQGNQFTPFRKDS